MQPPSNQREIVAFVQRFARTRELAGRASRENPRDVKALFGAGVAFRLTGDYASAMEQFTRADALQPNNHLILFELGGVQEILGQFGAAAQTFARVIRLVPDYYKAQYALIQIEKQTQEKNSIGRLERLFPGADGDGWSSLHIGHALAKTFEDLGDIDASFGWLHKAKARRRQLCPYSLGQDEQLTSASIASVDSLAPGTPGHVSAEPIFVVGLPRTGTTLVDRILSSHPQVKSAGEIGNFSELLKLMSATSSPQTMEPGTLSAGARIDLALLGRLYIDSTRPLTGDTPRFVDKAPSNYLLAGLILRALPNAKIVCVRRNPMDTVLSNFKQIFPFEDRYYDYVHELATAAQKYVQFDRIVKHWQATLPAHQFMVLDYETLVTSQETETRSLLSFCGLSWDPRCLDFHTSGGGVATPSARQVRQAMYTSSSGRWIRYGALLDPAKAVLERAGLL